MSTAEIIAELPNLSPQERQQILERIIELDDQTGTGLLEIRRHLAEEAFLMLDRMEAEDAENPAR